MTNPNVNILDYAENGWEVDEINVIYELDDDNNYNFNKKLIEIECENKETGQWDHIELKMSPFDYAYFVSRLIDDEELSQKVRKHLEEREKTLPQELLDEIEAESKASK